MQGVAAAPIFPSGRSHRKQRMEYTTLGRTGLRVSVAGLGTGGFSRMGLKSGKTEDEAARLVCEAVELGVNFIDTAPPYGTEGVVASLDNSLRLMGTDYVYVFNLHAVDPFTYDYARDTLAPALLEQKAKGKIRHIGLTENPIVDHTNEALKRAVNESVWEVFMVGFHMMHQGARNNVFPATREKGIGTLIMFAVRSIFADPPRVAREMKALAAKGLVEPWLGETDDPLGFLVHEAGAANMIEAAYRFARHEPGVDVVLFGTGDAAHSRTHIASLLKPPLPQADREKLAALFGHLTGIGLDGHQAPVTHPPPR